MRKGFLLYPIIVLLIFLPLLFAFFFGGFGQALLGHELPLTFGLFAFSLIMFQIILSTRPKFLESKTGLHNLYAIHGGTAMLITLTGIIHIVIEIAKTKITNLALPTAPLGIVGYICLLITNLMGVFYLSVNYIGKSPKLMQKKDRPGRREVALWLHRLSLLAAVLLFGHIISIAAVRENKVFSILLAAYFFIIAIAYGYTKLKSFRVTHVLDSVEPVTPDVHKIIFKSLGKQALDYRAGQYVFVRFIDSELPKESHPFSIVSASHTGENSFTLMAKESGDYTRKLKFLKEGDKAAVEGPYGNFWNDRVAKQDNPIVLMAGGIGITPHLSILHEQIATKSKRSIYLIWGAGTLEDTFDLDYFHKMEDDNPNFKFNLILSVDEDSTYPHGLIDAAYLAKIGIEELYSEADFFVCGPSVMLDAMKSLLLDSGVDASRIHLERFAF